ncbi:conserved hypothetical protein [Rhodococcus sp. RD6.2]|jgi:hypothetical protein|uniref:antitoxin n=1 Tax=Rhodococcus sp. RD6.2 TaxID=260936 RepID=UPI00063BAE0F|nr:antitoxin [Rhodococcus sp. RD6.2]CRK53666.1 conserved hypothetical protein [Rhodococcus sp. RD6.2]
MSLVNTLKDLFGKGQKYAAENSKQVEDAITKAGDFVDEKTGRKYSQHIDKAQDAAKKAIPKDVPPADGTK